MKLIVKIILLLSISTPASAWQQHTTGNCSPVMQDTVIGGSVTITCTGIAPEALKTLNELLNSAETIKNLNRLLDLQRQKLSSKDTELQRTYLTLPDKITLAEQWRQGYLDLNTRLLRKDGNKLEQQAAEALQAGDLDQAGRLLDELIVAERVVDKLAANHFYRAEVFQLQYKPVQALPHLKKAYNYLPENREYAFGYALLLARQKQFKPAILIFEDVLKHDRELGNEYNVAMTLNNLAFLYSNTNRYEPAEKYYLEALELYRKLAQANPNAYLSDVAMTLNNLAILYYETNRYEPAEKHYSEALDIRRKLAQANPNAYLSDVAMTLNNLGILYNDTNHYEPAEKYYLEALDIYRKLAQTNPNAYLSGVATTLNNLAILYKKTNRYEPAEEHFLEALDIHRKLAQANPNVYEPDLANTLDNLGKLHFVELENKTTAHKYFSGSLPIHRRWYKKYPQLYATKLHVTLVLSAMTSNDNLCSLFKEALSIAPSEGMKQFVLEKMGAKCQLRD
jgi:tetratricopeptide (TPR) repeat protein